jgi:hypothetical protein
LRNVTKGFRFRFLVVATNDLRFTANGKKVAFGLRGGDQWDIKKQDLTLLPLIPEIMTYLSILLMMSFSFLMISSSLQEVKLKK